MKKLFALSVFSLIVSSAICGCASYSPSDGETYFRSGEVYRMITLQGEPENVQNFPLEVIVDKNPVFTEDVVTIKISEYFPYGSIFFENPYAVNSEGATVISDILGASNSVQDSLILLNGTNLYTYTPKEYLGITMDFTFDTTKLSDNEYVGFTGDVEIYTFSYVDRAVDDGAVVGNGTFRAIKCVERTLVEIFRL